MSLGDIFVVKMW